MSNLDLDVAIFGGGVTGLWTLARLSQAGFRAVLFERQALGGIQSIASQGIIHGGTKYALTGKLTGSAMAIGEMPGIWRAAFEGEGQIDLRAVRILSEYQYLWTTGSLSSAMAGFFAGKVMQSRIQPLSRDTYPAPFDHADFRGQVYRLDEPVLDPRSLAKALVNQFGDHCFQVGKSLALARDGQTWSVRPDGEQPLRVGAVVLASGAGNARLLANLGRTRPAMQTRPLHMLLVRGRLPTLHAHCLGASANPRLTITSYPEQDGSTVWYLGGDVAEAGVERSPAEQIEAGRRELADLLPWFAMPPVQWATLRIDRAEVATPSGRRPDDAFVAWEEGLCTCWPTKLAFAPRVAQLVMEGLPPPAPKLRTPTIDLPTPPLAKLPWDEVDTWT